MLKNHNTWMNPFYHLVVAILLSLFTAVASFRDAVFDSRTLTTFLAFYLIMGAMALMFLIREKLTNPGTRQLLQFSQILLGFVLMIIGVLGLFNKTLSMRIGFIFMLFLPGLAIFRAGLLFNKE